MDALDDLPEGMGAGQSVAEEGVPPTSQGSEEAAALGPQLSSPKTNEESSVHRHEVEAANEAETAEVAEAAEATEADAEASSNKAESAQAAEAVEADAKVTMQVAPSEAETAEVAEAAEAAEADAEEVELSITEDPAGIELTNDAAEAEEELLFTIDAAGEALMTDSAKSNDGEGLASAAEVPETDEKKPDEETGEAAEADSKPEAACSTCGLFGHDAPACPFAHPEDIDLGDLEESDSDDELAELYPLFSRYVQQHIGALTPKDRKGLTGGGRYFGQEKQQACWACAETGHDANDCPDKGCCLQKEVPKKS
ncbi:unnamed protein product [Durusdinium trenchii]|uniref:CCHC-type domain-containing protein n=1 Tax=Durusdinium trenchii TaxID=1381693 RepID=A0ABP0MX87_9DINO